MSSVPLNTSTQIKLDGSGNGTAKIGPIVGQRWDLSVAAVSITNAVLIPLCSVYMGGSPTPDNFVDGTYTGSFDSTDRVQGLPITNGQYCWAVWSGGDPNAIATLSITGSQETQYKK